MAKVDTLYNESDIRNFLKEVKDPEIPPISIVDLGIVTKISVTRSERCSRNTNANICGLSSLKNHGGSGHRTLTEAGRHLER